MICSVLEGVGDVRLQMKGLLGHQAASTETEAGHRVFGGSSWESDDRTVFGNLRVAWSALFPLDDSSRKEGFSFQRLWLYLYYTFSSKGTFKGRWLFFFSSLHLYFITDRTFASGEAALISVKLSARKQICSAIQFFIYLAHTRSLTYTHSVNSKHWLALVTDLQTAHPSLVIISPGWRNDELAVIQRSHII